MTGLFRLRSVRSLFLLIITGVGLVLALILLWAGVGIMNTVLTQYGTDLMQEKLNLLVHTLDVQDGDAVAALPDKGIADDAAKENAITYLAAYRFKNSGSVFVMSAEREILLSHDFLTRMDQGFEPFFSQLQGKSGTLDYTVGSHSRFGVFRYYEPWQNYIGLAIDRKELYAPKDLFVRINLMLVAALLVAVILFSGLIQRLIISPLIRLANYANRISRGEYDAQLEGSYHLELAELQEDIRQMVETLRRKIDQTEAQVQVISEREIWIDQALNALQDSEKKYRTIYNAPTEAILIYDPRERKIIDANRATLGMFGLHHDDIRRTCFGDLGSGEPPFSREETEAQIAKTLDEGPQLFEWLLRKQDGEPFWVEISLQASFIEEQERVIAVIRDIHARKMAEQELASEKERLGVTLRSIGDGVITTDENGRVLLLNRVAEKLTGWRQAEAAGRLFRDIFRLKDRGGGELGENPAEKVLTTRQKKEVDETAALVAKDGSMHDIAHSAAPILDRRKRTVGAVVVFRDITEERKMEEELFKVKKLESVGVLAGGIAHDFNNILVAILGNLSLARQKLQNDKEINSLLVNTEKAALRARDLTTQLLTFSRGGEPVIRTASVRDLIKESAEFVLRGSNVRVDLDIPEDLWLVNIDTGQISQVIQNIVLNARQASVEESIVSIRCRNCTDCGDGPAGLREQCVRITIHDNGPGIPPEILPKIFDPYFSTREDGSGLGLAICHSIINKHKANITVESVPDSGTTFTIELPCSPEQKVADQDASVQQRRPSGRASILVMDDDPMILELATRMLEYLGHEVVTCEDGRICLELYNQAMIDNHPFDLVIMDLTIPGGMGGGKAIRELLQIDPQAKAIVSSGYSNDPIMAAHADYGFSAVVVKPYQLEDLDKAISKALAPDTTRQEYL